MKLLVLFMVVTSANGKVLEDTTVCNGLIYQGIYHEKEILKTNLAGPYQPAVDYSKNTLYFSFGDPEDFKSAYLNVDTKEYSEIEDLPKGFSHTVDQNTHEVYIGSPDGLFKFNPNTKKVELIGEKDKFVWSVILKDVLYYTLFSDSSLHTFVNNKSEKLKDFEDVEVHSLVIDDEGDFVYVNSSGLFSKKSTTEEKEEDAIEFEVNRAVRALTTDKAGKVYVTLRNGIYTLNKSSATLIKVLEVEEPLGVAFDRDGFLIYTDTDSLIRLKPKDNGC